MPDLYIWRGAAVWARGGPGGHAEATAPEWVVFLSALRGKEGEGAAELRGKAGRQVLGRPRFSKSHRTPVAIAWPQRAARGPDSQPPLPPPRLPPSAFSNANPAHTWPFKAPKIHQMTPQRSADDAICDTEEERADMVAECNKFLDEFLRIKSTVRTTKMIIISYEIKIFK